MATRWVVHEGDCRELAREGREHTFDAIVCDPPYDLVSITKRFGKNGSAPAKFGSDGRFARLSGGFMGQKWDSTGVAFDPETWVALLRVAKPGAFLVAFGGSRTFHRMMVAIEDSGWEIRDTIGSLGLLGWMYGSGFPKSHNVSKGIDSLLGAEREVVGAWKPTGTARIKGNGNSGHTYEHGELQTELPITASATEEAQQWEGWGTALKPAWEPIVLARAPLSEKTVAANALKWGTGAINVDGCRLSSNGLHEVTQGKGKHGTDGWGMERNTYQVPSGRWPANVVLDEEGAQQLDAQSGMSKSAGGRIANISKTSRIYGNGKGLGQDIAPEEVRGDPGYGDVGGPSRFMYVAKASKSERGEGNIHPTCKPIALMRWLCRLVTPPNGIVLDPFCGSGSTGVAALQEGFRFVGIEQEPHYAEIARKRLAAAEAKIVEVKDATSVS